MNPLHKIASEIDNRIKCRSIAISPNRASLAPAFDSCNFSNFFKSETRAFMDRLLNNAVFEYLLASRSRLTGSQLNFIRGNMNLSQAEFAKRLGFESHATVSGWLKKGNEASGMNTQSELAVRMLIAHFTNQFDAVNENAHLILSKIEDPQVEISVAA